MKKSYKFNDLSDRACQGKGCKEMIELKAQDHKVDFLIIEDNMHEIIQGGFKKEFPTVYINSPYIPKSFIKDMEKCRTVTIEFKYIYNKGFIHWLAWKLRTINFGKKAAIKFTGGNHE